MMSYHARSRFCFRMTKDTGTSSHLLGDPRLGLQQEDAQKAVQSWMHKYLPSPKRVETAGDSRQSDSADDIRRSESADDIHHSESADDIRHSESADDDLMTAAEEDRPIEKANSDGDLVRFAFYNSDQTGVVLVRYHDDGREELEPCKPLLVDTGKNRVGVAVLDNKLCINMTDRAFVLDQLTQTTQVLPRVNCSYLTAVPGGYAYMAHEVVDMGSPIAGSLKIVLVDKDWEPMYEMPIGSIDANDSCLSVLGSCASNLLLYDWGKVYVFDVNSRELVSTKTMIIKQLTDADIDCTVNDGMSRSFLISYPDIFVIFLDRLPLEPLSMGHMKDDSDDMSTAQTSFSNPSQLPPQAFKRLTFVRPKDRVVDGMVDSAAVGDKYLYLTTFHPGTYSPAAAGDETPQRHHVSYYKIELARLLSAKNGADVSDHVHKCQLKVPQEVLQNTSNDDGDASGALPKYVEWFGFITNVSVRARYQ